MTYEDVLSAAETALGRDFREYGEMPSGTHGDILCTLRVGGQLFTSEGAEEGARRAILTSVLELQARRAGRDWHGQVT